MAHVKVVRILTDKVTLELSIKALEAYKDAVEDAKEISTIDYILKNYKEILNTEFSSNYKIIIN